MTKLEQEIWNAQRKVASSSNPADHAKAAADVAKKYIEKAYDDGYYSADKEKEGIPTYMELKQAWLKENGIE